MIFPDSNFYIDCLREGQDASFVLQSWIQNGKILTCGLIRAEVLRGIREAVMKAAFTEMFDVIPEVPTDAKLWRAVTELAWMLDRKGLVLPVTDIAIACCAMRHNAEVITSDRHFSKIPNLKVRASLPARPA